MFSGTGVKAISRVSRKRPERSGFEISTGTWANISPVSSPVRRLMLSAIQWTPLTGFLRLKRPWLEVNPYLFPLQRQRVTVATAATTAVFMLCIRTVFFLVFFYAFLEKKT